MTSDSATRLRGEHGLSGAAASPVLAIAVLAGTHFLVDLFAGTVSPLWQGFESRFGTPKGGLLWVTFVWYAANSVTQLAFGWWADRGHRRWLIWAGALTGVVCLSGIGLAESEWTLAALLLMGGLGIASFHPEAAASAGAIAPNHRSRMMAVFALCGYLGQAVGPYYSSRWTSALGMPALAWGGVCGAVLLAVLFAQRRRVPSPPTPAHQASRSNRRAIPWQRWSLLLSIGALRVTPAVGVPLVLAYWLDETELIGTLQSIFMGGIGVGSILCAIGVGQRWERPVLWLLPLAAAPCLLVIPTWSGGALIAAVGLSGVVLGVSMPVFISYGQQMLPDHPRAASSITMGASWGLASAASWGIVKLCTVVEVLEQSDAFVPLAATSAAAGVLSLLLPRVGRGR